MSRSPSDVGANYLRMPLGDVVTRISPEVGRDGCSPARDVTDCWPGLPCNDSTRMRNLVCAPSHAYSTALMRDGAACHVRLYAVILSVTASHASCELRVPYSWLPP